MRCLSATDSATWCQSKGFTLTDKNVPVRPHLGAAFSIVCEVPTAYEKMAWFARLIATSFTNFDQCLLWVTHHGASPANENLHLFYRLRQSYGEIRLLEEAPGHLFHSYEIQDLATFVQLSILSGWEAHMLPSEEPVTSFLSHDEWVEFYAKEESQLAHIKHQLDELKLDYQTKKSV